MATRIVNSTNGSMRFTQYAAILGTGEEDAASSFDFAGQGPPPPDPNTIPGVFPGAKYLDEVSGDIYTLADDGS